MKRIIDFTALILLMLIAGVFWGTWFPLTQSLEKFSAAEFIHIGKVIINNVAAPMQVIFPAGLTFTFLSIWYSQSKWSLRFYLALAALLCYIAALVITLTVLVPIDIEIKSWTLKTIPSNWRDIRDTWKSWHAGRTLLSLAGFACYGWYLAGRKSRFVPSD